MKSKKTKPLSKIMRYIGKYKLLIPVSMLFALITVTLTLYVPKLIGDAIDLIPFVTGVGETVKGLRFIDKAGNTLEIAKEI